MQFSDIRTRVITRLEWSTADLGAKAAAGAAINEGQRLFAFLTLSLEAQRDFKLTPGKLWYRMLDEGWSDWLVPLRVRLSNDTSSGTDMTLDTPQFGAGMPNEQATPGLVTSSSPKLRPASMYAMAAESSTWLTDTGTPSKYGVLGWDFLYLNKQPTVVGQRLLISYGRSASLLVNDGDIPEIHPADHEALIDYAEWRNRANEGGQELATANSRLAAFLDVAKERADQVRARSLSMGYDREPFELENFDYSRLLKARPDLAPTRKENRWTGQA